MAGYEKVHIAITPPDTLNMGLVNSVAGVINKSSYDTRLLLTGGIPRFVAHSDNVKVAESLVRKLTDLGIAAIAFSDSELHQSAQVFKSQTLEFGSKEVIFRDSGGLEKRMGEDNVFLIMEGRIQTSDEVETTVSRTRLNLTATLLTGGIPIKRKVKEKTTTRSTQTEYLIRLYDRQTEYPCVEILQHHMNYSSLGAGISVSSRTNFNTVSMKLREIFPRAIFDNRLSAPSVVSAPDRQVREDVDINCKLIYSFNLAASGFKPAA